MTAVKAFNRFRLRLNRTLALTLLFPSTLLHELTHYLAFRLAGREPSLHLWPWPGVDPGETTGSIPERLAYLAPSLVGAVPAVWLSINNPGIIIHPFLTVYLAVSLAFYTLPSQNDVRNAFKRSKGGTQ